MATKIDGETNGCIIQWEVENVSRCLWSKTSPPIVSSTFIAEPLEGTKWSLVFDPVTGKVKNDVGLYLYRVEECSGPPVIEVKYQLAFLDREGTILKEETETDSFDKNMASGFEKFETQERVFPSDREAFVPEDTLTVQCTLQKPEGTLIKSEHLYARTVLNVHRKSFNWRINKFSSLKPGERKNYKDDVIEFDLFFNEDFDKLSIDLISVKEYIHYFSLYSSIIDSKGKRKYCGVTKYDSRDLKIGILKPTQCFPKMLLEENRQYLPNNVLSLNFKFALLTAEDFFCGKNSILEEDVTRKVESQSIEVLIAEFKTLCNDGIFSDTELRTPTKTFPAHRNILSARSPVFKRMFSHDMKENRGHVDIIDLEDDIIHRMLLFLYTAKIEGLQLESASKLYEAADKYEILSLKCRCSSFLKQNLGPTNACGILVLADLHNDDDLKSSVEDYILGQRKRIFCSQEWKDFINTHSKLAADVMYKKIYEE